MLKNGIVDIVNLNADASCLSASWWIRMLEKGENSYFYCWLNNYVRLGKKVSLGITGATLSDIVYYNPQSIKLINNNRNIFELILRPFAHDMGILRSQKGFLLNLNLGKTIIENEFGSYTNYFLPPEFMLSNIQICILKEQGIEGTFINPDRFRPEIRSKLSKTPYNVMGVDDAVIKCIPFKGNLTKAFLNGIHFFNANEWNNAIKEQDLQYSWRDGESSFFIPNGNDREFAWLKNENSSIKRYHLSEVIPKITFKENPENTFKSYPVHSFTAWLKEFRMMGFIHNIRDVEAQLDELTVKEKTLWLQIINSDILSSVEKDSPVISIIEEINSTKKIDYTIWRKEKGFEGEVFLNQLLNNNNIPEQSDNPIWKKYYSRYGYIKSEIS